MLRMLPGALDVPHSSKGETVVCHKGQPFGETAFERLDASYDCLEFPISTTVHPKIGAGGELLMLYRKNSRSTI
jgi:hypothetical protein